MKPFTGEPFSHRTQGTFEVFNGDAWRLFWMSGSFRLSQSQRRFYTQPQLVEDEDKRKISRTNWCCCDVSVYVRCLCTCGHCAWTIVIIVTPLLCKSLPTLLRNNLDIALSFLVAGLDPEDKDFPVVPLIDAPSCFSNQIERLSSWTIGGVGVSVFHQPTFPLTSLTGKHPPPVWLLSHDLFCGAPFFSRGGCGFCGATTARKQGPLLWRLFSHRASNHDNSPAEKHPSNPCLLARRHN